jgi:hypothetical protein
VTVDSGARVNRNFPKLVRRYLHDSPYIRFFVVLGSRGLFPIRAC